MKIYLAILAALAIWSSTTGCAMCRNPFDYCGPVVDAQGCPNCDFGARRGSMFAPIDGTPATTAFEPTPAKAPNKVPNSPKDQTPSDRTVEKEAGDTFVR